MRRGTVPIVFSGVVMSYPWANNVLYRLTGSEIPIQGNGQLRDGGQRTGVATGKGERTRNAGRTNPSLAGLNALWQRAENQVPGWRSITLRPPPSGRGPMTFTIDTGAGGRPDQLSQLTLDRRTAEVVRWGYFRKLQHRPPFAFPDFVFLHTGEAGGVAGQTVAGIASAGAAVLVWTGLWLACRRFLRWKSRGQEHRA